MDNAGQNFNQALTLYAQAASLRPLWRPNTWAEMAGLKIRLHKIDDPLQFYVDRPMATGPYTDKVHQVVVAYGLVRLAEILLNRLQDLNNMCCVGCTTLIAVSGYDLP